MVRAVRSPGSTLKPFIHGLAFDLGVLTPDTLVGPTPGIFVLRASPRANVSDVRVWDFTGNAEAYLRSHAHRMYALLAVHSVRRTLTKLP